MDARCRRHRDAHDRRARRAQLPDRRRATTRSIASCVRGALATRRSSRSSPIATSRATGATAAGLRSAPVEIDRDRRPARPASRSPIYQRLCEQLVARGLDRGSAIVALGGGVVGDLAGLRRGDAVSRHPGRPAPDDDRRDDRRRDRRQDRGRPAGRQEPRRRVPAAAARRVRARRRSRRCPARERRAGFGELWKYALLDGRELWRAVDACARLGARSASDAAPPELRDRDRVASIAYKAAIVGARRARAAPATARCSTSATPSATRSRRPRGMLHGEAVGARPRRRVPGLGALGHRRPRADEVAEALRRTGLPADLDP